MRAGTSIGRMLGLLGSAIALVLAMRGVPHECHPGHEADGPNCASVEEACLLCGLQATPFLPEEARLVPTVPVWIQVAWVEGEIILLRAVRQAHLARGPPQC